MNQEVIFMQGPSGAGKSTLARVVVPGSHTIISRDIIRLMLGVHGKTALSTELEKKVTRIECDLLREALYRGEAVIVDDMNIDTANGRKLADIASSMGVPCRTRRLGTPLEECIRRSELPEKVVRAQYKRFLKAPREITPHFPPCFKLDQDDSLSCAYIFDIDGTLATINPDNPRDVYDGTRVHEDLMVTEVSEVLRSVRGHWNTVLFVTGRDEEYRDVTTQWLRGKNLLPVGPIHLYMRPRGNTEPDSIIKFRIAQELVKNFSIKGVFDDRERVIDMWRTAGFKVFDVGQGIGKF